MVNSVTRAVSESRAVFFTLISLIYAIAIIVAALTLNPYFAQTWDVMTFIHAARTFTDSGSPFDLYAQSRAAQTWPYAYPPFHALVTALALALGDFIRILPDYVWARVPAVIADVGVAYVLWKIVAKKTRDEELARIATVLWLFNPITFYGTAVQGHFESEWIVFILLAYLWYADKRNIIVPSIALAFAVLFKQTAILFAIPLWMVLLKDESGKMKDEGKTNSSLILHPSSLKRPFLSGVIFALSVLLACLPFLLYSDDFVYMNLTYVENVPVQTQSWIVALLGITRESSQAMTSDFFLLRYQTIVTMLVTLVIALVAVRRNFSLYLTAMLIALAFFLTSKKVMGYYYVMLFPFLFAELVSQHRWRLLLISIAVTTWVSLSPYYASWTNHAHWWIYALLGTLYSLFFLWLGVVILRSGALKSTTVENTNSDEESRIMLEDSSLRQTLRGSAQNDKTNWLVPLVLTIGLFVATFASALLQPLAQNTSSPIRAPIINPGTESMALIAFIMIAVFAIISMILVTRILTKNMQWRAAWGIALIFAPLFFSVYYLTKESTAIIETVFSFLGV